MRRIAIAVLVLSLPSTASLDAQVRGANVAGIWDRYTFDAGLSIEGLGELQEISQYSVPFTIQTALGARAALVISGGYSRVELVTQTGATTRDLVIDGPTDLEARVSVDVVPGRVTLFATGAVPTGTETVEGDVLPVVNVLVADVLSFSTRNLGTGGSAGLGIGAAVPAGNLDFGFAGSYTRFGSFNPVAGQPTELDPGGELRLRAGIEGPLGLRTYLRVAGIFSRKSDDFIDGQSSSTVGNRISAYVSLDQSIGRGTLTLYAFDAFRDAPQIEFTALGPAALPRGNLVAGGAQAAIPLSGDITLIPRAEMRRSDQAVEAGSTDLEKLGTSTRIGADLTFDLGPRAALVVEGEGLFGDVQSGVFTPLAPVSADVGVSGFRFGVHLSVRR